jgi:hypothetical protein
MYFISFWYADLENKFKKLKKNIILIHFGIKKYFEKQPQSYGIKNSFFSFLYIITNKLLLVFY